MRCGSCGGVIEREEDVTWIRGTAVCLACASKGRAYQRVFFIVWLVLAILMLGFVATVATWIISGFMSMK